MSCIKCVLFFYLFTFHPLSKTVIGLHTYTHTPVDVAVVYPMSVSHWLSLGHCSSQCESQIQYDTWVSLKVVN